MFIIEKPYMSDVLEDTLASNDYKVLANDFIQSAGKYSSFSSLAEHTFRETIKASTAPKLYANSENAITWLNHNLPDLSLTKQVNIMKNKSGLRNMLNDVYPDYFFKEVKTEDLNTLNIEDIPLPFVIKPNVGFFSLGVHVVNSKDEWKKTKKTITQTLNDIKILYPKEVLNINSFIIEEYIDGKEIAVDAYYNDKGEAVILNILRHYFASDKDTSDRLYTSSKSIITKYLQPLESFLNNLNKKTGLKNFPLHLEVRLTAAGKFIPIEINPLRFAGWCCTDSAFYSYGINTYEYFMKNKIPDWKTILKGKEGKIYTLCVLNNSSTIPTSEIKGFDYENFVKNFKKPLCIRKVDFASQNFFGFLFTETEESAKTELNLILNSDFADYIIKA